MAQKTRPYGFGARVDLPFDEAIRKVTEALAAEGFGVLTEIDVKSTLKEKLDVDFQRYTILGACNPALAHRALVSDLGVGLLLPCNVIVYETHDGRSAISMVDPRVMLGVVDNPELVSVAKEAREKMIRALEAITG